MATDSGGDDLADIADEARAAAIREVGKERRGTRWILADIDVPFLSVLRFMVYTQVAGLIVGLPIYLLVWLVVKSIH
jgi:hypothetical protein